MGKGEDAPLAGRTAVVTGAAGALGSLMARDLAGMGATVFGLDVAEPGESAGAGWSAITCDVADAADVERAIGTVAGGHGDIDVLVNAAGVYDTVRFTHLIDPVRWARDVRINLSAAFYTSRLVVSGMAERGWGRIVNISSMLVRGGYKQSSYAATKAGLLGLTSTLAVEYAGRGVTSNAVLPGLIETPKTVLAPADILDAGRDVVPAARFGTDREVSAVVCFLCSPEAAYVNGVHLTVDGGTSLLPFRFARRSDPAAAGRGASAGGASGGRQP